MSKKEVNLEDLGNVTGGSRRPTSGYCYYIGYSLNGSPTKTEVSDPYDSVLIAQKEMNNRIDYLKANGYKIVSSEVKLNQ